MNKILIYGGSIVALGIISFLGYQDPVKGGIAALILLGLIVLSPKISKIKHIKGSADGIEIDSDSKDTKPE